MTWSSFRPPIRVALGVAIKDIVEAIVQMQKSPNPRIMAGFEAGWLPDVACPLASAPQ
jgi:hypothetical protein